ncbi:RHS repeat-associated core domain-containing protein, partial [Bacteroides sp. An269]|uniref:RHS repeat domain-containing protein n=1 Tax=Bacteroides sp. An269 TaxID=1965613 RepID=UPI000B557037
LLEDPDCLYHYDDEGNLIFREFKELQDNAVPHDRKRMEKERGIRSLATGTGWLYEWASNGMLKKVIRPDGRPVDFRYDALGRRTAKRYFGKVTRWVWDGNVPLHEWSYKAIGLQSDEEGNIPPKEPAEDITTWVFEAGTFVPAAKIQDGKQYSIVSDYMGTPIQMYDGQGNKTWECSLDIYGKVVNFVGKLQCDCPFRFQGQYADEETGLYYNRFRYYDASIGNYISQDPIGLAGNNPTIYGYVLDTNIWIDIWGLHLNSNSAISHFGIYEIRIKDKLYKIGKADMMRITKSSDLPTRLHQQIRKLEKIHGKGNVEGFIVEDLGITTTLEAKNAETARLQSYYDKTGKVPEGNQKSFKPKNGNH